MSNEERLQAMTNKIDAQIGKMLGLLYEGPSKIKVGDNEWILANAKGVTL